MKNESLKLYSAAVLRILVPAGGLAFLFPEWPLERAVVIALVADYIMRTVGNYYDHIGHTQARLNQYKIMEQQTQITGQIIDILKR